jgi:hypothetical protein
MMGGVGIRTSRGTESVGGDMGGVGAGDNTLLRRTFAVGRLTRRSAELKVARGMRWQGPLLRAMGNGAPRLSRVSVH